jgi:hypothetical protein
MDVKKKRGRKPKNQQIIKSDNIIEEVDTEKECIICHIPVSLEEINNTLLFSLESPTITPLSFIILL